MRVVRALRQALVMLVVSIALALAGASLAPVGVFLFVSLPLLIAGLVLYGRG